jgi:phage tail sheath protein FI
MIRDDLDLGRLIIKIDVAPVRPAEFGIYRTLALDPAGREVDRAAETLPSTAG